MKWFICSDLHGSAYYCKRFLDSFEREQADRILFLGDILYHGPRNDLPEAYSPKTVIPMLNQIKEYLICVRGNCDSDVDQMVLDFPITSESCILPIGNNIIFATHGDKLNKDNMPPLKEKDILLFGHTHIAECTFSDGYYFMNPGSLSLPKGESTNSYMTFENDTFTWKDINGNISNEFVYK